MTRLKRLTIYLEKAETKPTYTLAQEVDQQILIMRLKTWLEKERKHVKQQKSITSN